MRWISLIGGTIVNLETVSAISVVDDKVVYFFRSGMTIEENFDTEERAIQRRDELLHILIRNRFTSKRAK